VKCRYLSPLSYLDHLQNLQSYTIEWYWSQKERELYLRTGPARRGEREWSRSFAMGQSLQNLLGRHSDTRLFAIPDSIDSGHEHLQNLLLQRTKLSNDIAQIRALLKKVSLNRSYSRASLKPKSSQRHHRSPSTSVRPARRELERACRIALMEAAEAISAENVYDRIQKRGSLTFAGYKRPLRAIALAMNALVKRREAGLMEIDGSRRWRWEPERTSVEDLAHSARA
jgi:hypothetical protein